MAKGTKKKKKELTIEEKLEQALVPEEEWPYEIPENWCWVKLESISYHISDGSHNPPQNSGKGIPLLSATNIHDRIIDFEQTARWITDEEWVIENERTQIELGDVLLTIVATIGRVAVVRTDQPFALQRSVATIKPKVDALYLSYYFESPYIQTFMNANAKGTAQKGFYLNSLKKLYCAIPPLVEQQRIVNRIESLLAKLDEAKEKAQVVVDGFEDRKAAILYKAFTGELTKSWEEQHGVNKEHWKKIKLKDCGDWIGGGTPSKSHPEYWDNGNILWITSKDMKADLIEDSQLHINMLGVENSSANYCEKNSVLFVMRSGILRRTLPIALVKTPFTVNQDLKAVSPCSDIDVDYLFWACESNEKQILKTCMKSGTTVESINAEALFNYEIPIVPIEEQILIVKMIDNLLYREKKAAEIAEKVLAHFDTIKKSILAQAFCGELGTNDSNDESAAELLKRIL